MQGLAEPDLRLLERGLRFTKPCSMSLELEGIQDRPDAEIQADIIAAVRQLAPYLPEASEIGLLHGTQPRAKAAACAALAAVATSMAHVQLMPSGDKLVVVAV